MFIKHYNNSFFLTKIRNTKLVCDPWIGELESTGTWSYPNLSNNKNILNTINPNIIYISHLHNDHFDKKILSKFVKKKTIIIIKKFKDMRLKNLITNLGYKNVIALDPWKKFSFREFELTVVPCDSSNSAGITSDIFYDLDTSIIIHDKLNNVTFYNNVDNPLSFKSLNKLKNLIDKNYKKIDIASVGPRSASEYPQCFLNVNRKKEKIKIISKCLDRSKKMLQILKPKYYVPAGGSYIVYGKYHSIQKFVGHPSNNEIKKHFKKITKLKVLKLDSASSVEIKSNKIFLNQKKEGKENKSKLNILKKRKYSYMKINSSNYDIKKIFKSAKNNYFNVLKKLDIKVKWKIKFFIYDNLELNNVNKINKKDKFIYCFSLSDKKMKNYSQILNCYLDKKLFISLLTGKEYNWNLAIGGSLIMFERYPNKFIPDVPFSLNFFRAI